MEVTLTDFLNQLKAITMEKEKTENLIKIMQAFLEGETVEERIVLLDNRTAGWITHTGNDWNTTKYEYRIKPKPQYRPFKDQNECWEEMQKHQPFGWVKVGEDYEIIAELDSFNKRIMLGNSHYYGWKISIECITFADGTPFGIKDNVPKSLKS